MTIYEKLAAVHAAIRQPIKDGKNPHFNSASATLNECNRVVADAVREVGECDYWQRAIYNAEAGSWEMQTVFSTADGEIVLSSHPFKDDQNPQKSASASTYARRYSLQSAFCLAAEDDDGNRAAEPAPKSKAAGKTPKQRLWAAITRYAELRGEDPNAIADGMRQSSGYQETAAYFERKAMEFERKAMELEGACDV